MLKNQGYIEKKSVLVKNLNTSKLTLTRFAVQRDLRRQLQYAQEVKDGKPKKARRQLDKEDEGPNFAWTGPTIDTEKLIKAILIELKLAKNRVLMHSDLKRKLVHISAHLIHVIVIDFFFPSFNIRGWTSLDFTGDPSQEFFGNWNR